MPDRIDRRQLLGWAGAVGLTAAVGCAETIPGSDDDGDGDGGDGGDDGGDGAAAPQNGTRQQPDWYYDEIDFADPEGSVRFVAPEDGATVENPVQVELAAEEFELIPTEDAQLRQGEGHLNVLIDMDPFDPEEVIPVGPDIVHLEDGGTETELDLDSGDHDLVVQATDSFDTAYDLTDETTITVGGGG